MELTFRPRLTRGSHLKTTDETGDFCLVEAVGFNADGAVSDHHISVNPVLAALGRVLNDRMCGHGTLICDDCAERLWAVGERIAGTGRPTRTGETRVNAIMALAAASAVRKLMPEGDPARDLVVDVIRTAKGHLDAPSDAGKTAINTMVSQINADLGNRGPGVHTWVGMSAAQAATTVLHVDQGGTSAYFAERRAIEAVSYAVSSAAAAIAGTDKRVAYAMGVARVVLNAFENGPSQKAATVDCIVTAPISLGGPRFVTFPAAECAAGDCDQPAGDDGFCSAACFEAADLGFTNQPTWEEHHAEAAAEQNATDNEEVDDFNESIIGDVADEAIGDLERAEAMLNAIAEEHQPVEAWARHHAVGSGVPVEYRSKCCVVCRDAKGQPVPAPCRTLRIIEGFGE